MRTYICPYCGKEFKDKAPNRRFCSRECRDKSGRKDLTGKTFGKLTAIRRLEERNSGGWFWLCQCECGNETKVMISALMLGYKKSCGCDRKKKKEYTYTCAHCGKEFKDRKPNRRYCSMECSGKSNRKDLTGQVFGKLTVISRLENLPSHWLCQCECGNNRKVPRGKLVSGNAKSCGCINQKKERQTFTCANCGKEFESLRPNRRYCSIECSGKSKIKDISGQVFGKLTVIRELEERKAGKQIWLCRCECGNYKEVSRTNLIAGHTRSCGCALSEIWKPEIHPEFFEGTSIAMITHNKPNVNNKSGVSGVQKRKEKWVAAIGFQRKIIHLGTFDKFEDAVKARREAEEFYYKPIIEKFYKQVDPKE